eukprot:5948713-Lingulodinium_polyedra.AAC.1
MGRAARVAVDTFRRVGAEPGAATVAGDNLGLVRSCVGAGVCMTRSSMASSKERWDARHASRAV